MAEILLTHSYLLMFDSKQLKVGQPYAPLGTLYAAAVLKETGFDVAFFDTMFAKSPDDLIPVIRREKPRILVIYEDGFSYLVKMCLTYMRDVACRMISIGKESGCITVVCSPDATDNYSYYLSKGADFCILGEGENTLKELVSVLQEPGKQYFGVISGIAWLSEGQVMKNRPRELITNLDELPFPAWQMVDIEKYRKTWRSKNGYFSMNMVTTRGCPYQCIWCAKPIYGNHYNSRSSQSVVKEMLFLKNTYNPDRLWFADDIFALKPGWIEEFESLTVKNGLNLPYTIQSRVDLLLDHGQIPHLAGSGCKKVWLGVESGSQKILDAMRKGTKTDQVYSVSPKLRQAGIEQAFFLQLGFPGETREDIRMTIRMLTELMPEDIGISVTYPLPGTKFYEEVSKDLQEKKNWTDSDDLAMLFHGNFPAGYYKILHRYIHKYFRLRQGLYFLWRSLTSKSLPQSQELRRILLLPYYFIMAAGYKFRIWLLEQR
jgi:anaerobic magnesium-protoporphyrin IX monomethyl ester cyclase